MRLPIIISRIIPRKVKAASYLLLMAVFFCLTGSAQEAGATTPLAGKLIFLQGEVSVQPSGGNVWKSAELNQNLYCGDVIKTGSLSRASILCVDESQIKLNQNTTFSLKSAAPSSRLQLGEIIPAAQTTASSLYGVPQGEIWLRNSNEKFKFELETPAVTAAIRGTEFNLQVLSDGASRLTLLNGSISLSNPHGQLMLQPGEEGFVRPGQAPTKRVLVQPADAVQWALYYPGIFSYRDLPLTTGPAGPAPAALVREAETAYDRGDLEKARQTAEVALAQDAKNGRAMVVLGWISLQRHELGQAQSFFKKVPGVEPMAAIGLALAFYRQGEVIFAYRAITEARRNLPSDARLTAMAGYFALLAGRVEEAQSLFEAARRQNPDALLPRTFLAQVYLVQNQKDAARKEALQTLAQAPDSPLAQLTMALVYIAHFELPAARRHLDQALRLDPRFVDAYIYQAKIWLGSDYLDRAWKTIEKALEIAPYEGEVLSLAGFIRLGFRDYQQAKKFFDDAVKNNPRLGEPHVGLGVYHFRHREFKLGLGEMLTATLLEPRVALYQTELGKALYQSKAFDKTLETYDYAKTLDPKDPTPYLYKGIALTDLYRPGEAVQEINRSIALNDNRAIFRSRTMLDRDLAVRNYDLAMAYNQLGLADWAYSKAVTAVKSDPTSSSAHLFLASSYFDTGQRVSAMESEIALYHLLSPANENTFSLATNYTQMFEMPFVRVLARGGIGTWGSGKTIQDHNVEVIAGLPGVAVDWVGSYSDDRGFRPRNSDRNFMQSLLRAKWEPTVKDSLFASYSHDEWERGDDSNLTNFGYQNQPRFRGYDRQSAMEVGYVHRFSPAATLLTYFGYRSLDTRTLNFSLNTFDLGGGLAADWAQSQVLAPHESINVQVQKQLILGDHTLIGGYDYFAGHLKFRERNLFDLSWMGFPLGSFEIRRDYRPPDRTYSFYLLDYWHLTPRLIVELGVFKDFVKNSRAYFPEPLSNSLWNPRFGLNYQITTNHTLRLALQRNLNTHILAPLLAPSNVAGFPSLLNLDDGAIVREAGVAWEAQWNPLTFTVLRLDAHRIDVPQYELDGSSQPERVWWNWKRYQASLILNRILHSSLGLKAGVVAKRLVPDTNPNFPDAFPGKDFSEVNGILGLTFQHHTGWQAKVSTFTVYNHFKDRADNLFSLVDVGFGKKFDNKRGFFLLEVTNLFNRHFFYQQEYAAVDNFFPMRRIMFRLGLYF